MLTKKLVSLVLAGTMALQPFSAMAVNLEDAFNDLTVPGAAVSMNEAGRFSSAARGGVSFGGMELRVPRDANTPTLLSATPPTITAGCNGISAHFGGFSFISGAEFTDLLKQIASGAALGYVASLVMKSLCPMCEAVVQELKAAAQAAARLAKDSCSVGEAFARSYMDGDSDQGSGLNTCAKIMAESGESKDTVASARDLCSSLTDATTALNKYADSYAGEGGAQTDATKAAFACQVGQGNLTWTRLTSMEAAGATGIGMDSAYVRKVMLMNLMGADLSVDGENPVGCEGRFVLGKTTKETDFCAPKLDARTLTGIFMCGAPGNLHGPEVSARVQKYCNSFATGSKGAGQGETMVYVCEDPKKCNYLTLKPAGEIFQGAGFLMQVNKLLLEATRRVREGDPAAFSDDLGAKLITLIDAAPYPLYQAINAAAVYPAAASDLLDTMSLLVAEQFTHSLFEEMLRLQGRTTSAETTCVTQNQTEHILNFVSALRSENANRLSLITQNFVLQEALTEQIRQINLSVQRQVMSSDLLATGQLSQSLNRALSPTGPSAP